MVLKYHKKSYEQTKYVYHIKLLTTLFYLLWLIRAAQSNQVEILAMKWASSHHNSVSLYVKSQSVQTVYKWATNWLSDTVEER